VALFGVAFLLALLGILRFVAIFVFAASVVSLLIGVVALFAGFTAAYIYEHGLVQTKNGRRKVATWNEVTELLLWRAGGNTFLAGTVLCYYAKTRDGRKLSVEARFVDDRDAFGELLQDHVRRGGGRVVESGPAAGVLRP
jgi:hypothetical protein